MKKALILSLLILSVSSGFSQELTETQKTDERISALESKIEKLGQLKFSGYVQTQWTWDELGIPLGTQNLFSVRRGRLKAAYTNTYGEAVIQIDACESGVTLKDAYLKVQAPSMKWIALRGGVFDRPFGYEISYSSSRRESPERSRVFQTLFPKERDLGAEIILKGPEGTALKDFTLNAGLFSGNGGQAKETDSKKDFIGHLAYTRKYDDISYGLGASLYSGGVRLAGEENQVAYKLVDKKYVADTDLKRGDYAKRQYYGFDGQLTVNSALGMTNLRGEYLWGVQPGEKIASKSPTGLILTDIYSRNFSGYYIQLVQDIGASKHSLVGKYDVYDPNTKLSKNECQNAGDVSYSTFGFGWLYRANQNIRLMCYYEITSNEKVKNDQVATIFNEDISDNVFTLRLQYKF